MSSQEGARKADPTTWPHSFSTLPLPRRDQFEAWRGLLRQTVELRPVHRTDLGYPARFSSWAFGGLTLTRATFLDAPPRARDNDLRSWRDDWCVVLARGPHRPVSGALLHARSLSLWPLSLALKGEGQDGEVLTLYVPRDRMSEVVKRPDRLQGTAISAGLSGVLAGYMEGLLSQLPLLSSQDEEHVARMTLALLATCVAPSQETLAEARAPVAAQMVERARVAIRQNIGVPDFGPERLCRMLAVSRSKLYRFFEDSGGVAQFIQRERLIAAHERLSNPAETSSIHMIGQAVGFLDHSTFSRAFRREFGCSPSHVREAALARCRGQAEAASHPDSPQGLDGTS